MSNFKQILSKSLWQKLIALLSGGRYSKSIFLKELKKGDSVFLRVPKDIPQKLLNDFSILFNKYPEIFSAYLAEGFLEANESPHHIVGIELDPKSDLRIEQLMQIMAKEFNEIIPKDMSVDFIGISEGVDAPINDFMKDYLIPFYKREKRKQEIRGVTH